MKKIGAVAYLVVAVLAYAMVIGYIRSLPGHITDMELLYRTLIAALPVSLFTVLTGARAYSLAFPKRFWGAQCTGYKNITYRNGLYQPEEITVTANGVTRYLNRTQHPVVTGLSGMVDLEHRTEFCRKLNK